MTPTRSSCAVWALSLLAPAVSADVLYVDAQLATGADDGSSWADAFQGAQGLQAALAAALAGDQVWVADGTYLPTDTGSRSIAFALKNGVELFGSFAGGETSLDQRPPFGSADSILSGDLAGNDGALVFGDNSFHVITTVGTESSAVLDGFVVSGGAATGSGNNDKGAGILCLGSVTPVVRNCRFRDNRSTFGGAHGYVNNLGGPSFLDCTFERGTGGSFGGAFDLATAGTVRFERCLFRENTAARGGALEIFLSIGPEVTDCIFIDNVATGTAGGGALWIGSGGNTRVRNCTVVGNRATTANVGGLRVQTAPDVTIANSIFWDNEGSLGNQGPGNQVNAAALVDHSLVQWGFGGGGVGNISSDPQFVDLPGGNLRLQANSPAVDAGDSGAVLAGVLSDFDGLPRLADVLAADDTGLGGAPVVDMGAFERPSVWLGLGQSLAGTAGAPKLVLDGPLTGGSTLDVSISLAAPSAPAYVVVGLSLLGLPFKGGVLVPNPDFIVPTPTSPAGTFSLSTTWPTGLPSSVAFFSQAWVQDGSAPVGFAASQGVQGITP